jgi:hypothetical protein
VKYYVWKEGKFTKKLDRWIGTFILKILKIIIIEEKGKKSCHLQNGSVSEYFTDGYCLNFGNCTKE